MNKKEKQYREYLAMRESYHEEERETPYHKPIEETPYGASNMRKQTKKQQQREREMQAYLAVREEGKTVSKKQEKKYAKQVKKNRKKNKKKKGRGIKVAIMVFLILVVGIGALVVAGLTVVEEVVNNVTHIDIDETQLGIDPQVEEDLSGYRNVAFFGIDARDMTDSKDARSDCIMVASINRETSEVKLFSVYRDTLLLLNDERGLDKVTHAYYYGGAQGAIYCLNRNLDLNIHKAVVVNWKAVADTIDALGGVDIDVEESALKELNKYIPETAKNVGGPKDKVKEPGMQTLNGVQAVTYARIRKDALTGDFRRNERMKIVVQAMFDKAKGIDLEAMQTITNDVMPQIMTNMKTDTIMSLALKLPAYEMNDSKTGFPYDVADWSSGGYYAVPRTLSKQVSRLHEEFFGQKDYEPTQTVQDISLRIINRTGIQ